MSWPASYGQDHDSNLATNNKNGIRIAASSDSGELVMSEAGYLLNQSPNDRGLQGTYKIGSWLSTDNFSTFASQADSANGTGSIHTVGLGLRRLRGDGPADLFSRRQGRQHVRALGRLAVQHQLRRLLRRRRFQLHRLHPQSRQRRGRRGRGALARQPAISATRRWRRVGRPCRRKRCSRRLTRCKSTRGGACNPTCNISLHAQRRAGVEGRTPSWASAAAWLSRPVRAGPKLPRPAGEGMFGQSRSG